MQATSRLQTCSCGSCFFMDESVIVSCALDVVCKHEYMTAFKEKVETHTELNTSHNCWLVK